MLRLSALERISQSIVSIVVSEFRSSDDKAAYRSSCARLVGISMYRIPIISVGLHAVPTFDVLLPFCFWDFCQSKLLLA